MARNQRELLSKLQQNGSLEDATAVHISPLDSLEIRANEATIAHHHHDEEVSCVIRPMKRYGYQLHASSGVLDALC